MTFYCHCGLPIRQRTQGQCQFVFPNGKRCRSKRGLRYGNVSDHLPNVWYAGWEHYDPDSPCTVCGDHQFNTTHSDHPATIQRPHRAEEMHMASHCRPTTAAITEVLKHATPDSAEELIAMLDPSEAQTAREELAQLPPDFFPVLMITHATAQDAGVPFSLESEAPPKPIAAAKAGMVSYRIEHDEDGVRMYVAHVHGHHAAWMREPAQAAT